MKIGLIVPVYKNFEGFARLMRSVDHPVQPFIIPNWENNLGVSKAWNLGVEQAIAARCDLALICNDDVELHEGTLYKLISSLWYDDFDLVSAVGHVGGYGYSPVPDFSCFMIRPEEFYVEFGSFDENFTPAYFEDNDIHYRLKLSGGRVAARGDASMTHGGSVTQNWGGQRVVSHEMFEKNRAYYTKKWGGWPGMETFTHPFNDESKEVRFW